MPRGKQLRSPTSPEPRKFSLINMTKPSLLPAKVLAPQEPGQKAEYQPRWYDRVRNVIITDVPIVVKGRSKNAHTLFATSALLNTAELLEEILQCLEYQDLNNAYYTCKGFQHVVDSSLQLSQALFLASDLDNTKEWRLLPAKIFYPNRWEWQERNMFDDKLFIRTNHWYEELCRPPRLNLLDRFHTQPPFPKLDMWINVEVPATRQKRTTWVRVSNDSGIRLADILSAIKAGVIEMFGELPTHWIVWGSFDRDDWLTPIDENQAMAH